MRRDAAECGSSTAGTRVRPRALGGVRECVFRFYGLEPGVESAARVEEVVHVPVAAEIRGDMGRYAEICGDMGRSGEIRGDMGRSGEVCHPCGLVRSL